MRILLLVLVSYVFANEAWKLEKSSGLVKAYTADIGKPYKRIKINGPVNASFTACFDKYFQVDKQGTWMDGIMKSELLKKESDNVWYTRYEVKFPFPLKNRELVYKMVKTTTDSEILVKYSSVPNFIPANKDFIRMTISEGYWSFTKTSASTSMVESGAYNEAAGIPAWIVNMFIVDIPLKTVANFKILMESKK